MTALELQLPGAGSQRMLSEALQRSDYLRRSAASVGGLGGHKEWFHFCVHGLGIEALVNFSLCDDVTAMAPPGTEHARITVLVREHGGGWDGDVELHAQRDTIVHGGRIHVAFGPNELYFDGRDYRLSVSLRARPIALELTLRPLTMPSLANNVQLDPGPPINWLVVPRLCASGRVTCNGRSHELRNVPAYHDHNWGHFAWGRNFAWEWGFGLPETLDVPWSTVFVRLSDRAHTKAYLQALLLWKGLRQHRVWRADELEIRHGPPLRRDTLFKLPRPMALLSPDLLPNVPQCTRIVARAGPDALECNFVAQEVAQVLIPNDHDLGVTIINEVSGRVRMLGIVRGEELDFSGSAMFEFLGA